MEDIQLTQQVLKNSVIFSHDHHKWYFGLLKTAHPYQDSKISWLHVNKYNIEQLYLYIKIHHIKVSSESAMSHRKNKHFYQFPGGPLANPLVLP